MSTTIPPRSPLGPSKLREHTKQGSAPANKVMETQSPRTSPVVRQPPRQRREPTGDKLVAWASRREELTRPTIRGAAKWLQPRLHHTCLLETPRPWNARRIQGTMGAGRRRMMCICRLSVFWRLKLGAWCMKGGHAYYEHRKHVWRSVDRLARTTGIPTFRGGPKAMVGPLQSWKGFLFVRVFKFAAKPPQSVPFLVTFSSALISGALSLTRPIQNFQGGVRL